MIDRRPIEHPAAWRPADFPDPDAYTVRLTPAHVAALGDAVRGARAAGIAIDDLDAGAFDLGAIGEDLRAWADEVHDRRGFVVLDGFPVGTWPQADLEMAWFGLGCHFGHPVSQSSMGDRLGHVVDVGGKDGRERAYRNSRGLELHTDRCDVVGMFCLRPAHSGGVSGYASGLAVYNELLATAPELLGPLFAGYPYHRFGEEGPGQGPVTRLPVPVFSESCGVMSIVFLRAYMEMAAEELGEVLDAAFVEALDRFEAIAGAPEFRLDFTLGAGQAVLFNNATMLHTRTGFEDHPDPARRRHLLRLWLMARGRRPTCEAFRVYQGEGGVPVKARAATYYEGASYRAISSTVRHG